MTQPLRWTAEDWKRISKHAGLGALQHHADALARHIDAAQRALERLRELERVRAKQIVDGKWPPKRDGEVWA